MKEFCLAAVGLALLGGCGRSSDAPASTAPAAARPDIIVTLDGEHHACVVAKYGEPTGSTIGCSEVVSFVKDELRVPNGATYEIRGAVAAARVEANEIKAALDGAGFKFVGGLE